MKENENTQNTLPGVAAAVSYIDLNYLKELSKGDNKFILEMISVFISQIPEELNKMKAHLRNSEWRSVFAVAHKIKPSVAFMGIKELESILNKIENFASSETSLQELPELIQSFENISNEAIKELENEKAKLA